MDQMHHESLTVNASKTKEIRLREGFKKKNKKSDNYHFGGEGGVSEGHLSFFFGLKMIFKQF